MANAKFLEVNLFGTVHKVQFRKSHYMSPGNNMYLGLVSYDEDFQMMEPFCDITVNVDGYFQVKPGCMTVKVWSENSFIPEFLEKNGIAKPTGLAVPTGYVMAPEYEFDMKKVAEYLYEDADA